jgi:hypothetical protein
MGRFITWMRKNLAGSGSPLRQGSTTESWPALIHFSRLLDSCSLQDYNFDEKNYKNLS